MNNAVEQKTPRERYLARWKALNTERSSWISHYQEISRVLLPRAGRYFVSDRNIGTKRHNNIYDSSATRALRILAAGLMAGLTSPARPWFRLSTSDPDLDEYAPVRDWLHDVVMLMRRIFDKSNTYRSMHSLYTELGGFGTGVNLIVDDFKNVIHNQPLTVGEYAIAADDKGYVDTVYREFQMTVAQVVGKFGRDNVSLSTKNAYDRGNYDQWLTVYHAVEPRRDREYGKRDAKNMPFKSCYFEAGKEDPRGQMLRESGFREFPGVAARWNVTGGDIYGEGPGMDALGDIKQLQHEQLKKATGIDYMVEPPLQVPIAYKNQDQDRFPGGIMYVDPNAGTGKIESAFNVNLRLDHLLGDIDDVRDRINKAFYVDLFLMLANDTRSNITAREIAERHEEKLLMLGPVLERLHTEMLQPLIDITFNKMVATGILPAPPMELQNRELRVEFISMLAQAQRAVGAQSIDRLLGTVGAVAQVKPEVLDKLDGDQLVDVYADMLGVPPELIVADDKVAIIRQQRAQQQAAATQPAVAQQMADTAKTMSDTDTDGKNALTDVMNSFTGYTQP